jgi:subfamily B ATP-binding cassette protein MsbA
MRKALPEAWALARPYRGVLALAFVFLVFNRLAGLVLPAAPKFILDDALANQDLRLLYTITIAIVVASLVQGATMFLMTQTVSKAGQKLIRDLRIRLHEHVMRLPLRYFDSRKSGEVASRVMNDVEGVRNLLGTGIVELASGLITAILAMTMLFWLNWRLTTAALCFIALFAVSIWRIFGIMRKIFEERSELGARISGRLTESVAGVRVVKGYHTEQTENDVFRTGVNALFAVIIRTINGIGFLGFVGSSMLGLTGSVVLFIGGHQILLGEMQPGAFISYILYLAFMIGPVAQAVSIGTSLSEAFAGLNRMREVLSETREDANESARAPLGTIEGNVEFRDVEFQYEAGKKVLHSISFTAPRGTVTALVGPSGSGKSTIINLVAGFYEPTGGAVFVDGADLRTIRLGDYRRHLGLVLQDNFLFDGTVRENVLYSRPDATQEQLEAAARAAHATEFIEALPSGWDTVVGERGVKLSGGQRQRLAIARALLADPRILILDEATSSLDSESEASIQEALKTLMQGRTTFVIAHRLSTIRGADQILVIEHGTIAERGTHAELVALGGRYFHMQALQSGMGAIADSPRPRDEDDEAPLPIPADAMTRA